MIVETKRDSGHRMWRVHSRVSKTEMGEFVTVQVNVSQFSECVTVRDEDKETLIPFEIPHRCELVPEPSDESVFEVRKENTVSVYFLGCKILYN